MIYRRSLGDDLGDGLSRAGMSQRVGRAVSRGVFRGTVAVRLATLVEAGRERAGPEIADLSQTGLELLGRAFKEMVIGCLLSDNVIRGQIE
jgi:hypothetical protein